MHLNNVEGKDKDKDKDIDKDITEGYCNICNKIIDITIKMNIMNQMIIRRMLIRKNLLMGSGEIKVMS